MSAKASRRKDAVNMAKVEYEVELKGVGRIFGPYRTKKEAEEVASDSGVACIIWRRSRVVVAEVSPFQVNTEGKE
jgi:hypothetical protein